MFHTSHDDDDDDGDEDDEEDEDLLEGQDWSDQSSEEDVNFAL
jgi:hypothetical protein